MNEKYRKVPTRFGPDTRFEVKAVPFRAAETTQLERLKEQLLRQLLEQTDDTERNTLLRRAANDAAALAWATPYPLLLFPTLLEERARQALVQNRRQEEVRRRSLKLVLAAV